MTDANLALADLSSANLDEADLCGAEDLDTANLDGAYISDTAICPDGFAADVDLSCAGQMTPAATCPPPPLPPS